jgi:cellulase/cellobiase CelA1
VPPTTPPPTTVPPSTSPAGGCAVTYTITNQWSGGFQGQVDIHNTGTTAVNGWTLVWSFATGQQLTQIWSATDVQSGAMVTVHNETYDATIAPAATVSFGFLANWTTANAKPTAFTLNGSPCSA